MAKLTDATDQYEQFYYQNCCGKIPYDRTNQQWLTFFGDVADSIVRKIGPASVLDAGCAMGFLVESLRDRGVEAFGVDVSAYAIQRVREDIAPFCWVGSVLDPYPRRYDLIACIEVVEHLSPRDGRRAIANLCDASDDVLFSSSPEDHHETTHQNVQEPDYWVELFAEYGFWRDATFDASVIAPWAMRFRRGDGPTRELVVQYERRLWHLTKQATAIRDASKEANESLAKIERRLVEAEQTIERREDAHAAEIRNWERRHSSAIQRHSSDMQQLNANLRAEKLIVASWRRQVADEHHGHVALSNQLNRYAADLDALRNQHAADLDALRNQLNRYAADLDALRATRTVRLARAAGVIGHQVGLCFSVIGNVLANPLLRVTRPMCGALDRPPQADATVSDTLTVSGWATSRAAPIAKVEAILDAQLLGAVWYGVERSDVLAARPWEHAAHCGFEQMFELSRTLVGSGPHTLIVRVSDARGNYQDYTRNITIERPVRDTLPPALNDAPLAYEDWIALNEPDAAALRRQRRYARHLAYRPLMSVITPVYNPPPAVLQAAIDSVRNQTYDHWELCLVDGASPNPEIGEILRDYAAQDPRIRVQFLDRNLGIAGNTNAALAMANGEFAALLDHDDELAPHALWEIALLLNEHPSADMIYSDEDKLDEQGLRHQAFFKPDWSPDLFRSMMYTCHLGVYRTRLLQEIGGFREGFDGAQDYDLVLRFTERCAHILHIPKVLYHWRMLPGSASVSIDNKSYAVAAQIRSVSEHCERIGWDCSVAPDLEPRLVGGVIRVQHHVRNQPRVGIIIPTRDHCDVLQQCIESIRERTTYQNYEIVVVDNDSVQEATKAYLASLNQFTNIRVLPWSGAFNYAAIHNSIAAQLQSDLLLFLNNDTTVISPDWLEEMAGHAMRPDVGAVGARLLYPNRTLQHGGIILGIGGVASHSHLRLPADEFGYFGRARAIQNFSAVTGACMMTRREVFLRMGGFDKRNLPVTFNDVDYCLRLREQEMLIVWTPYAELIHYESQSRGRELSAQFQAEEAYMRERWEGILQHDPYYNVNLTLAREDYSLAATPRY